MIEMPKFKCQCGKTLKAFHRADDGTYEVMPHLMPTGVLCTHQRVHHESGRIKSR